MRFLTCWPILATAVVGTWAADEQPKKTDRDRIQGTWVAEATEINGKVVKAEVSLVIDGDTFEQYAGKLRVYLGTFELDEAKKPKQIATRIPFGFLASEEEGIYDLDGDTLKVCWGTPRPTEFATKTELQSFTVYKRKAK